MFEDIKTYIPMLLYCCVIPLGGVIFIRVVYSLFIRMLALIFPSIRKHRQAEERKKVFERQELARRKNSHKNAPLKNIACSDSGFHPHIKNTAGLHTSSIFLVGSWVETMSYTYSRNEYDGDRDQYGNERSSPYIQVPTTVRVYEFDTKYRVTVSLCDDCIHKAHLNMAAQEKENRIRDYEENKKKFREYSKPHTLFDSLAGCSSISLLTLFFYVVIPLILVAGFLLLGSPKPLLQTIFDFITAPAFQTSFKKALPVAFIIIFGITAIAAIWWLIRVVFFSAAIRREGNAVKKLKTKDIMASINKGAAIHSLTLATLKNAFPSYEYLESYESRKKEVST